MTQITREQQEQLQATTERVKAKLQSFYETLPDDEQFVLNVGLRSLLAEEENVDVHGQAVSLGPIIVGIVLDRIYNNIMDSPAPGDTPEGKKLLEDWFGRAP